MSTTTALRQPGATPQVSGFMSLGRLLVSAARKFDPRYLWHNPVLMITWAGAALSTLVALAEPWIGAEVLSGGTVLPRGFSWTITVALWATLYCATLAESLAEGRGRAQTAALRARRETTTAHRVHRYDPAHDADAESATLHEVDATDLKRGDIVLLSAGDIIPADGDVIWGVAMVDESAITGESAPVIRQAGGDRSAVTDGTKVLSDRIVVRVTVPRGSTAVDRMIKLAIGAHRQKAPNELALTALIASFSISFVLIALTLNAIAAPVAPPVAIPILVAIVVTLIPTEIAALMSVTGIASIHQLLQRNVLVDSARALETAGDITTVLTDKTGTITQGDRQASQFVPLGGVSVDDLAAAAVTASRDDPTPEGASTVQLARDLGLDAGFEAPPGGRFLAYSAQTRISGRDLPDGTSLRKGAESAILAWLKHVGTQQPKSVLDDLHAHTAAIARTGGTPLVVAIKPPDGRARVLGIIHLKDVVKASVPAQIAHLRALGIRTVMVTGDNPLTAEAIAAEAGVDDYLGDATPEDKLALIKREQAAGHFVAMGGDGTNDAPALAQADVGVAMNSATAAAKEAANMIVLDDDPSKLVEIVRIGRRQMATRGALVTFNMANDIIRYIALFPALFVGVFPRLASFNLLGLHTPASAVLSTVIFSSVVMGILIPLALVGVPYHRTNLAKALGRNLAYYGLGGLVVAAAGIKLIDLLVQLIPGY